MTEPYMAAAKKSKTRKQVFELTVDDLRKFPVWEFALNEEGVSGQDELTVRPYPITGALDADEGLFVVRAEFLLADGTRMIGYVTPPGANGDESLGTIQPVILTERGQISFWFGLGIPSKKNIIDCYTRLGKYGALIFPARFKSKVAIKGASLEGTLNGFLYLKDAAGPIMETR